MAIDLRRLAARTLCVGFDGTEPSRATLTALGALRPAGVILFSRNVVDVAATRRLVDRVREACEAHAPLLVAVDQEGGRVARLRRGAVELPSAMALAAAGDEAICERAGRVLARDLRRAGANLDFAPVLDVVSDPRNTVIGARSFGDDPERVARLGLAVARGLEAGGVAAVAKHFPGHGATADDSHLGMPVLDAPAATLRARDLLPFRRAVEQGIAGIMTAHVRVPALEPDAVPATLSHRLLVDLLRDELGFRGVCITDCLEMGAIAKGPGSERGAVEALRAGADLLVVSHTLALAERIASAIAAAVGSGALPLERLEQAVARVDALRMRLDAPPELPAADAGVAAEAARRSLVMYRGRLPHWQRESRCVVVAFSPSAAEGGAVDRESQGSLARMLQSRGIDARTVRMGPSPSLQDVERAHREIESSGDGARIAVVVRRAQHDPAQLDAARALLGLYPDALLIVAREPHDAQLLPQARCVLCTFGDEDVSLAAVAEALTGAAPVTGSMPVALAVSP
ncbi:MAG: beta-N-acetylhexosaminidase [bacterium]|nr:beta-N-acetylhexosaminidase [bacterium]